MKWVNFWKSYHFDHSAFTIYTCFVAPKEQKQPFADVLQNRCSYKFRNIHTKATVLESLFNKVAGIRLQKRLEHRCFPVNIAKFLRTAFVIEHLWCLLLKRTPSLSYLFIISIIDKLLYSDSHLLVGKTYLNAEDEWFMIFQLIRWTW